MASNINSNNIDGTYPVAGQDNDSQGFRTNFTNIKNNFTYAKSEIEDLQGKVIVKSALNGVTLDNNLAGTTITGATVKDFRETVVDHGSTSGTISLNHASGHYHYIFLSNDITLDFAGFTNDVLCKIRLEAEIDDVGKTITLPSAVQYGLTGIAGYDGVDTITFAKPGVYVFEFTSFDAGISIHIADLSRARTNVVKTGVAVGTMIGAAGDIPGMMYYDSNTRHLYICVGTYDGSTHIWHKLATQWSNSY